jgi:hypothetical protein
MQQEPELGWRVAAGCELFVDLRGYDLDRPAVLPREVLAGFLRALGMAGRIYRPTSVSEPRHTAACWRADGCSSSLTTPPPRSRSTGCYGQLILCGGGDQPGSPHRDDRPAWRPASRTRRPAGCGCGRAAAGADRRPGRRRTRCGYDAGRAVRAAAARTARRSRTGRRQPCDPAPGSRRRTGRRAAATGFP